MKYSPERAGYPPMNTTLPVGSVALELPVPYFVLFHPTPQGGLLASLSKHLVFNSVSLIYR